MLVTTSSADPRYAALSPATAATYSVQVVNRHRDRVTIIPSLAVVAPGDGTASYKLTLLNVGEHCVESINQTSDFVGVGFDRTHFIVLIGGDYFHGVLEVHNRPRNHLLQFGGH